MPDSETSQTIFDMLYYPGYLHSVSVLWQSTEYFRWIRDKRMKVVLGPQGGKCVGLISLSSIGQHNKPIQSGMLPAAAVTFQICLSTVSDHHFSFYLSAFLNWQLYKFVHNWEPGFCVRSERLPLKNKKIMRAKTYEWFSSSILPKIMSHSGKQN